jgi:imidazole glycerol-phosphate synthase subunit HisH
MIGIIDYGRGNLASVKNAFEKIGFTAHIIKDPDLVQKCNKIILPGVGAFGDAMVHLHATGMAEAIGLFAQSGKPLMGICLGMQLLFEKSYEFGEHTGLGLLQGEVTLFDESKMNQKHKIPHMGWNKLFVTRTHPIFNSLSREMYLYFVHSYHVTPSNSTCIIGECHYGYRFVSAVHQENIYGFQPHPEKSHEQGLMILKNFARLA